jgi:hypothetical protein
VIRGFGWWLCMHSHTDERRDLGRGHGNREGLGPVRRCWTLLSGLSQAGLRESSARSGVENSSDPIVRVSIERSRAALDGIQSANIL